MSRPSVCHTCRIPRLCTTARDDAGHYAGYVCPKCGEFEPISRPFPTRDAALVMLTRRPSARSVA